MKIGTLVNLLIVGLIFLILYSLIGYRYVEFYTTGKTKILAEAAQINRLCDENGMCPTVLDGWRPVSDGRKGLVKNNMRYFVTASEAGEYVEKQNFILVYGFFEPDHWYQVQGGVGKTVTYAWVSR